MAHLLLIDDDPNTLASLSRAFRLAGHEATVCDNARRAVELIGQHRYDVILSDVVMPGTDGLTLLEQLKGLDVAAPVVMISGQATVEMAVRATKLGAVDFLEKPLSTDKLLLTVENALKLTRLEREGWWVRSRRSAPLGRDAHPERDQDEAGDRIEHPADRRPAKHARRAVDRERVGAEPRKGHRAEDEPEREHRRERRLPADNRELR